MIRKLALICLTCAAGANAQSLSVGVIGGANFNDVVNAANIGSLQSVANSSNFSIGPSVRVNLPASFRIEVDALYRPYGFNLVGAAGLLYPVTAQQWRFPVLLQYRFNAPLVHPFVEAGLSFDHLSGISNAAISVVGTFFVMLWVFKCWDPSRASLFQTGWFVESLMTQTLTIHVIRTNRIPFI